MTKDKALKLALEALDCIRSPLYVREFTKVGKAMKAIKEAMAQSDQEPVAWMREDEDCTDCIVWEQTEEHTIPLYITPPQRKPLTEREILDLLPDAQHGWTTAIYGKWVARAVERAHGVKGKA